MAEQAAFTGFPLEAVEFYDGLEADNSKAYWQAHRAVYESACLGPMQALLQTLEPEFGPGKIFRPYRDVRFSADKSPYKTQCAALIGDHHGAGGYVALSADGLLIGGGVGGL